MDDDDDDEEEEEEEEEEEQEEDLYKINKMKIVFKSKNNVQRSLDNFILREQDRYVP